MRFLPILQTIKLQSVLKPQTLLDMAYIVVLLPLLLILKAPILLFAAVVIGILLFKQEPAGKTLLFSLFLFGMAALFFSFYGSFNFQGLSRLKLFLELLVSILVIVVSLQRVSREINFYLLISPILFLALSLFFFHGLPMLIYVIFEIFFLLWMTLTHRMEGDLIESFRASIVMFLYSLPWVVVLFIFFPRISFEHANYGFKGETVQRMGHDGTMFLDNKALLVPSERVVFEVGFERDVPTSDTLYFRGSTLYIDKKNHWEPLPAYIERENKLHPAVKGERTDYRVTLYPTQKRWIYLLDMPSEAVEDAILDRDFISTLKAPIKETIHYTASSVLSPVLHDSLDAATLKAASSFSKEENPKTYHEAEKITEAFTSPVKRADAILKFFRSHSLTYSLKPAPLDMEHTTDSFLFDKHRGYCVHFTSSFVTMTRMAGIPSRIVTGYKADRSNSLKNYLAVKERNAHAWAELYLDGQWVRYETTHTAKYIEVEGLTEMNNEENQFFKTVHLYLMYTKYQVETWILHYSNIRQLQLLQYAKEHPIFILKFALSLLTLLLLTVAVTAHFRRPHCTRKVLCLLHPLMKKLAKEGCIREKEETLHRYLLRCLKASPHAESIKEINVLYEKISYGGDHTKASKKRLKRLVKKAVKEMDKGRDAKSNLLDIFK